MSEKQSSGGKTKKNWILIAALVAIAIGAYNSWFSEAAHIRKGDELQKQDKNVEAIKTYDGESQRPSVTTNDPYLSRGVTYNSRQDYSKALADYAQVIMKGKVRIKEVEEKSAKLEYKFQELLGLKSKDKDLAEPRQEIYRAYVSRGDIYKEQGDWANAIENYTKAIELNDILSLRNNYVGDGVELGKIYDCRGECYSSRGDYAKAVSDFTKALEMLPDGRFFDTDKHDCYLSRGYAYHDLGDTEKAAADFVAWARGHGSTTTTEETATETALQLRASSSLIPRYVRRT